MGNKEKVLVEVVDTYRLILDTEYHLDLMDIFYVSQPESRQEGESKKETGLKKI